MRDTDIVPVEVLMGTRSDVIVYCGIDAAIDLSHAARVVLGRHVRVSTEGGVSAVRIGRVRLDDVERAITRMREQRGDG